MKSSNGMWPFGSDAVAGYSVSGGTGGTAFAWDELLEGAYRLIVLEQDAQAVRQRMLDIRNALASAVHGSWVTYFPADSQLFGAGSAVRRAAEECGDLAARLHEAFATYQVTELLTAGRFVALRPMAGPAAEPGEARRWTQSISLDAGLTTGAAELIGGLGLSAGMLHSGPIRWESSGKSATWTVTDPPTVSWWVNRNAAASGTGRGNIEVLRVRRPNGTVGWAITVPGTQLARSGETVNPLDESGVAEAMLNNDEYFVRQLPERLREAGARTGDEILLNGHSQGGLHAIALAAHPALTKEFRVRTIITAGSPVAGRSVPDETTALNLEHVSDPVPQLDGAGNANTRNQVTVTFHAGIGSPNRTMDAHALENYVQQARRLELAEDAALQEITAEVKAFVPAGSTLTAITLHGTREFATPATPASPPRPAPGHRNGCGITLEP